MDNQQNTIQNENLQENTKVAPPKFNALKIINIVLFVFTTLWFVWGLIDIANSRPVEGSSADFSGLAVAVLIIYGTIGYIISFILSVVGTIVSAVNVKNGTPKGTLILFILIMVLTVIAELVFLVVAALW